MQYATSRCINCNSNQFLFLYKKNNFNILKCNRCRLVFTDIPAGYDIKKLYGEGYFNGKQPDGYTNYKGSENVLRKEFCKNVAVLRKLTNYRENLRLLEVGSAFGYFLDEARQYFDCNGIEISEEAVKYAGERGHNIYCGEINEELLKRIGSFDIVAMFDVIEHLPNPIETLSLLDKYLESGGLFLVVTGDIDSVPAKIMKRRWRLMTPPQHTCFFSKGTLTRVFRELNYDIIKKDRPWKFVPLGLVFYQLGSWLGVRITWLEKLNKQGVYLNLFDTVRIAAQKRI